MSFNVDNSTVIPAVKKYVRNIMILWNSTKFLSPIESSPAVSNMLLGIV